MTYTSSMAQAWVQFHARAIALAVSSTEINNQIKSALSAVSRLRKYDVIDIDEYNAAIAAFNTAANSERLVKQEVAHG